MSGRSKGDKVVRHQQENGPVRQVLDDVFGAAVRHPFRVKLWDGSEWRSGDEPPKFTLELKNPSALRRMLWRANELSLGESYIFDDFDIQGDVEACFELADHLMERRWRLAEKVRIGRQLLGLSRRPAAASAQPAKPAGLQGGLHSKQRDARAIRYHYDVSNDFYRLWLDERMVYSCAFFHAHDDSLDVAQLRKLDYICRKLRLAEGETLLDIGCGWGGLIMHAAREYGVDATGITLSRSQVELANARIREAGLGDRCRVMLMDYRDVPSEGAYDKLVSVGMFEHVGEAKLPEYFRKACNLLKPGGVFLNHGITEAVDRVYTHKTSFIDRYVFPDGELVPISTSLKVAEECGFEIRDLESLREHYAKTLRHWFRRLEENRREAIALTSPVTYRIWRIYMAGSAYGFETGRLNLYQGLLVKAGKGASGLPLTRCDWYRPCPNGHH